MTDSFRASDGRKLAYRREGAGPALVCHPGGPGYSSLYFGDLAGLGEHFTLVMLNPRGTDGSDRPPEARAYRLDDYVADLEELRIHLGTTSMNLLGHSHGGVVAVAYAAAYPTQVGSLVLASSLVRFAREQLAVMTKSMAEKVDEPWYEDAREALEAEEACRFSSDLELGQLALREFPFYFAHYGADEAAYLETLRADVPNGDALRLWNEEVMSSFDLRPELTLVDAQTLVITGEQDFITGPVCAGEIADGIAGAELIVIPETGHFVFVEARDRFRDEVAGFLGAKA